MDMEEQLETLRKQCKTMQRNMFDTKGSESVTKDDIESIQDRLRTVTQQQVSATLSAWHDKMEGIYVCMYHFPILDKTDLEAYTYIHVNKDIC